MFDPPLTMPITKSSSTGCDALTFIGHRARLVLPLREERDVQFPFAEKASGLDGAIKNRKAHYVGPDFVAALKGLKPYRETGGNRLLYLIHELDVIDKHMLLIPVGDYTKSGLTTMIRGAVSDFPYGLDKTAWGQISFRWQMRGDLPPDELGAAVLGTTYKFQREIRIPVDVVLEIRPGLPLDPIVPLLHKLIDTARQTITLIRRAAS
jgi:hypothetical protein